MGRHVLATRAGNRVMEPRAGNQTNWPLGYGWSDPHAIPPPGIGHLQRAGVLVTEHTLLQVDVVFTALRIISNNIIKMGDLWAYREALSNDGIPYRVFLPERPRVLTDTFGGGRLGGRGGMMMQCTGRDRSIWSMALFGEAFWYVLERDRMNYPSALDVLHPAFMEVRQNEQTGLPVYIYGSGARRRELDPDNVIHVPFKSLPGARRGLSSVEYAGVAGALAMAAYEFGSTWFSQGASPSFLLTTERKLGTVEVERIAQKFLIEHSGLQSSHLPLVLDSGLKAEKVMASPDEAQYLHTLEYSRNVIASWFGLPPSALGNALERQTPMPPHTSEEEATRFNTNTLSGYLVPLEEAHSGLLPDGVKAAFNEAALAKPDSQSLAQLILNLRQSQAASVNDIRTRYMGWAPVDGGDDVLAPLASNTAPEQTKGDGDGGSQSAVPRRPDSGGRGSEGRSVSPVHVRVEPAQVHVNVDVPEGPVPAVHVAAPEVRVDSHNHVEPTPVNVAAPTVNVAAPHVEVKNDVQPAAPEIRIEPSTAEVKVEPHIDVPPAEVTVRMPKRRTTVKRDRHGRIQGIEED